MKFHCSIPAALVACLAIAACGGSAPRPRDVSQTDTTSAPVPATTDPRGTPPGTPEGPVPGEPTAALRGGNRLPEVAVQGQGQADLDTTASIRRRLVDDRALSASAKRVMIVTNLGKVTLRGPVKSQKELIAIENHARKGPGVLEIDNQLEIDD